ncbi:hypothetical protein [Nocardia iowensis]|uniref:Uncharacterized protein n=1 Tax=Nocardia iowensis TaxID=204891 RepID=A0ABX8RYL2_NOCIO|nr:hypothetical protein [Nocardia iowensis]QXN94732.1 hypothetical protein KV110_17785 [Nocardia iowensis]
MFEGCHTPKQVAHLYRNRYGLAAELSYQRAFVLTDDTVGAILMPPWLGQQVKNTFREGVSVPIIRHGQRGGFWIFLVGKRRGHLRNRAGPALTRHNGTILPPRSPVWLPMTDAGLGWTWHSPPRRGALLPARTEVLHSALVVIDHAEAAPDPLHNTAIAVRDPASARTTRR